MVTSMLELVDDWEFNVLGIYNYRKPGPFDSLFNFVRENHDKIPGDIVESGVYRGSSLLGLGMLLKELGSTKKVYGYDSFGGFPPVYHAKDDLSEFDRMAETGLIDDAHIAAINRNRHWRETLSGTPQSTATISTSGDFSGTSLDYVKRKIDLAGLDNVVLVDGPFAETMTAQSTDPQQIMAVLMDCDLYNSYLDTFNFVWPRLADGGMIYLDEYYSLKFPGARLATLEYIEGKPVELVKAPQKLGDFERWYLKKRS